MIERKGETVKPKRYRYVNFWPLGGRVGLRISKDLDEALRLDREIFKDAARAASVREEKEW